MAWEQRIPGADLTGHANPSTTAISYDASGNYSSGGIPFGTVVVKDTSDGIDYVSIASSANLPYAVAATDPAAGPSETVRLVRLGSCKVLAGAAITIGDLLVVGDSSGRATTAGAAGHNGAWLLGVAEESATAAGDLITVRLMIGAQQLISGNA